MLLKHLLSKTFKMLLIFLLKRGRKAVIDTEQLATMSPSHHQPEDTISLSDYQPPQPQREAAP